MKRSRQQKGSVLVVALCCLGGVIAVALIAIAMTNIFTAHTLMQDQTDRFALESALSFNAHDYAGRTNLLTGYSREMVYDSRQIYNKCRAQAPELEGIAEALLHESRESARLMETERRLLSAHVIDTVKDNAKKFSKSQLTENGLLVLGGSISRPTLVNMEVGNIEGTPSNATVSKVNSGLSELDKRMGYVKPGTDLYVANTNLRLPEDSDLNYNMSALPSYGCGVQGMNSKSNSNTAPPAALCSAKGFERQGYLWKDGVSAPLASDIIPSAVRCNISTNVATQMSPEVQDNRVMVNSAATTNGTNPEAHI